MECNVDPCQLDAQHREKYKGWKAGANSEAMSATEDTVAKAVGVVSAEMTSTTKGFVTAAATSDMYEVTAGRLATRQLPFF